MPPHTWATGCPAGRQVGIGDYGPKELRASRGGAFCCLTDQCCLKRSEKYVYLRAWICTCNPWHTTTCCLPWSSGTRVKFRRVLWQQEQNKTDHLKEMSLIYMHLKPCKSYSFLEMYCYYHQSIQYYSCWKGILVFSHIRQHFVHAPHFHCI